MEKNVRPLLNFLGLSYQYTGNCKVVYKVIFPLTEKVIKWITRHWLDSTEELGHFLRRGTQTPDVCSLPTSTGFLKPSLESGNYPYFIVSEWVGPGQRKTTRFRTVGKSCLSPKWGRPLGYYSLRILRLEGPHTPFGL